jgi:5'-nucleotidase (lipoprotein e(P4) family)
MRQSSTNNYWYISLFILILSACGSSKPATETIDPMERELSRETIGATLWSQHSAEARFIYYQNYHYARLQLDRKMRLQQYSNPAIVLDLDETVLDNSIYQAKLIREGRIYTEVSWQEWVREERATALPGALDFVNYARSKGVEIFYISNRSEALRGPTITNLVNLGFPSADNQHVLLQRESSDKTSRRNQVTNDFQVVLYLGDNLRDFSELFNQRQADQGLGLVSENLQDLLNNFILFPNPMYGEWEEAILRNQSNLTPQQKMEARKEMLRD